MPERDDLAVPWDDRAALLRQILTQLYDWQRELGFAAVHPRVLAAIARLPREDFLPTYLAGSAYVDRALDIACGQRISAPSIVAVMTGLLQAHRGHRVLEIGTGSGYQTAILSQLVSAVYSVELEAELAVAAVGRLRRLGFTNVAIRHGDGRLGWRRHAPFDRILVTAAAEAVPQALLDQLKPGGRMVLPVASTGLGHGDERERAAGKVLAVIEKRRDNAIERYDLMPVRFVPLR